DADIVEPKLVALIVALATIFIKELMYHLTIKASKKARSQALAAIALDNRSDVFASLGALIGIGGAMLGFVFLEPLASLVICLFIARLGFRIIKQSFGQVVDEAACEETITKIEAIAKSIEGVISIDDLKTRMFGMKLYIDIEIAVDRNISLSQAHAISHKVHDAIEQQIPEVKHCMVHVNPA
ncbi:MAG: cation transporter, partial [Bacilli bacterium]|nr:cation transporter [Bacilli bacterium]